ncbi:tRNA lysidine(34) synthetase TilS [Lederbergia lenta]|uniref:tRNA lysidine(34) synthetase TilS n=1 Tax=Lederbergia lenta TaxID=1467 RepID=UPI00204234CB|nr:tRNA lysidine(34) synthetase TilS [Lederbergia lenta]MCM3113576.1 tRNA lysidine(34) synthetase TilS [Lederbergia lenta]
MLDFERKTELFVKKHVLFKKDDFIIVAVSGGPDSMAMLDFLVKRQDQYGVTLVVAHVDHMLRGEESLRDLEYVKNYCASTGLIFKAESIDIKSKMKKDKTGLQETARVYRYQFLEQVMEEFQANKLVVGQHGDDQIETILMRLTRGSREISRAGIQVKRKFGNGELIRPLLGVSKSEIEEYCKVKALHPRRDESNDKPTYTRNRFRLDILPFLKEENSRVHEQFQRFSEEITEDEKYLRFLAKEQMEKMCQEFDGVEIRLNISLFKQVPLPLQRRGIHLILNYLYQQYAPDLSALHIDLIQQLIKSKRPSGRIDLPNGLKVIRSYEQCNFTFTELEQASGFYYVLEEDNDLLLPNQLTIRMEKNADNNLKDQDNVLIFDPNTIQFPIIVRTRRPGDRMKIKGMNGSKKVKNIFMEMKIPLQDRRNWPIITDNSGQILWIPGLKKSCYNTSPNKEHIYYSIHYSK